MNSISNFQLLPIENDKVFEDFVCDVFNFIESTNSYELYGRMGQMQNGIDIYSIEKKTIIQCKHKLINRPDDKIKNELLSDLNTEFESFLEYNQQHDNHYNKFILASTFKNDARISDECLKLSRLNNISIEYWSWTRLTKHMGGELLEKYFEIINKLTDLYYRDSSNSAIEIFVDKDKPLLDQIYDYLIRRFDDVKILPPKLFVFDYPFQRDLNKRAHRRVYTFKTFDKEFFNLFENFEFKDGALANNFDCIGDFKKANFIVNKLTQHNIFNIVGREWKQYKSLDIEYNNNGSKLDFLDRYEFIELFKMTETSSDILDLDQLLDEGYFQYKFGNLLKSKDLFIKAGDLAKKQNNHISFLITQHNLFHLSKFIEARYWILPNRSELIKQLNSINLLEISVNDIDEPIKELIASRSFFSSAQTKIQGYSNKIEEFYYSYLRGAKSSMNFDYEIIYEYALLNSFLIKNRIIYDEYSDYTDVVHCLFKSILASYSIKKGRPGVTSLDDYILNHCIEYGTSNEMEKYFKRYEIFTIDYKSSNPDFSYVKLFENFAKNSFDDLNNFLSQADEPFVANFKERHRKILNNFLLFNGRLNLDDQDVEIITNLTLDIISNDNLFIQYDFANICKYFIFKRKQIDPIYFVKLILYAVNKEINSPINSLIDMFDLLKESNVILPFTDEQFGLVLKKVVNSDGAEDQNYNPYNFGSNIFGSLLPKHQEILQEEYLLELELNFDKSLYYLLTIYDIIEYSENNYFNIFLESINMDYERPFQNIFSNEDSNNSKRYEVLDNLLNICFKENIGITDERFEKFKGYSDYYDWLFDVDNFDYDKFDPYWLSEYGTMFYHNEMRKHKIVKDEVYKHIVKSSDNRLKEIYFNVFVENNEALY